MAKKKTAAKSNGNKGNAAARPAKKDSEPKDTPPPTKPSSFLSSSIPSILVATLAFAIGILSPPLLKRFQPNTTTNDAALNSHHLETRIRSLLANATQTHQTFPCSKQILDDYLHDTYVPGLHIVCFSEFGDSSIHLKVYQGAMRTQVTEIEIEKGLTLGWTTLRSKLEEGLNMKTPEEGMQPWAMFTPLGERILDAHAVETDDASSITQALVHTLGMGLLYEGGQFIWPGVKIGFERQISLYSVMPMQSPKFDKSKNVTLETLSLVPLVLSVKGFLAEAECDHIQEVAAPTMEYSGVVLMDHDKGKKASDFRTSQTTFVGPVDDTFVDIDYRTASLVRIPRNHQEHVQVLRYGESQYYQAHHDFFTPEHYKQDAATLRLIKHGIRNRLATVFWYLSDVEEGGETAFPRFNRGREKSFDDCETGLLVKPEKGKVIIFYSMTPDGVTDQYSLHGACPVKEGIKWAANKWVWNEKMGYTPA